MSEETQVLAANQAFYDAFARRDVDSMKRLWAERTAVACTHPGWTALTDREHILESWEMILGQAGEVRVSCFDARAVVAGGLAFVTCNESIGNNLLAATNLFVREGREWRMVHHHASPVARAYVKEGPQAADRIH
ncbi:MAG: DUF4440 domain-containing protein [Alphaproteobacteria bacterium]|nr:DUF4440 domain-containing protein [Alphaproteobacteria bacterium]